ncbi:MAG: RidA family protein [Candidatus Aminicenantia bacterium]
MKLKKVFTESAPKPKGHYSQGIIFGNLLFISGQLPINPKTGERVKGTIEEQTIQVLENIKEILHSAGTRIYHVLKTTVYLSDMELWDRVNRVYSEFFGEHRPARSVVPTKELHYGFQIEIEAIAFIPDE